MRLIRHPGKAFDNGLYQLCYPSRIVLSISFFPVRPSESEYGRHHHTEAIEEARRAGTLDALLASVHGDDDLTREEPKAPNEDRASLKKEQPA